MMKINLLKCFPHRFLKHETEAGEKVFLCGRCMRVWPRVQEHHDICDRKPKYMPFFVWRFVCS